MHQYSTRDPQRSLENSIFSSLKFSQPHEFFLTSKFGDKNNLSSRMHQEVWEVWAPFVMSKRADFQS